MPVASHRAGGFVRFNVLRRSRPASLLGAGSLTRRPAATNAAFPDARTRAASADNAVFPGLLDTLAFDAFAAEYRRATGFALVATDAAGAVLRGRVSASADAAAAQTARQQAIAEALRWGEPCVMGDPDGRVLWAVPVLRNQTLLGGLLVCGIALKRPARAGALDQRILHACRRLLELAARHNLTNAALLAERRRHARREREKAEALHALKEGLHDDIRSIYLREEPALIAAIRRGERPAARGAINRVLTAIYFLGESRMELLKSLALELVVTMTRTAVQAGGDPSQILGLNYQSITTLARIGSQEELATWLCEMLELLIDAIQANRRHPNSVQLARAIEYMEEHLAGELTREEVARAAGLSPSHFSHLMRDKTGRSFTELLTQLRVDRACHLLARTETELAQIAQSCGFGDQSYFTRVFRKATQQTPGEFRRAQTPAAP